MVWYGLARREIGDSTKYVPLDDGVSLGTGDGIQIFMSLRPSAYVYVLHQTTSGQFVVLWPVESERFNAYLEGGRVQTLPSRGRVYTLQPGQGTGAIYLIATDEPIIQVDALVREIRWLFASAQALAAEVPAGRIREMLPGDLRWRLDLRNPPRIRVVDQAIPVATTVRSIGELRVGQEQFVTTAEGFTYGVRAEQIDGKKLVARVIRLHRTLGRP